MTIEDIARAVGATSLCGADKLATIEVSNAYACDLMSDVLAFYSPGAMLITGLTNIQIVRTAQMLDIPGVMFVRGKTPPDDTIALASDSGIPLVITPMSMFQVCGLLYAAGIRPCFDSAFGD